MFPEGAPRERRSRLASVRRGTPRTPRAAALLRPGPYRTGWLIVLIPAFVLLVGARTAPALPRSTLPPTFDGAQALSAADEVVGRFSDRSPGSAGDAGSADWVADRLRAAGADVTYQRFRAPDAGGRTVSMINVLGVVTGKGRTSDALVFIAGRDDLPPGPGADDNGSGTGALVELARTLVGSVTQTSLVFASVDGTTAESAGARELARHPPGGLRLAAGVSLRAIGRPGGPIVLRLSGEGHRLPAAGWLRTVEQALRDEGVGQVRLPSLGQQVTALVAPAAHGDQAALVGDGAAVIGIDGSLPGESSAADLPKGLSADLLGRVGTAAQLAALAFDTGPRPASLGTTYLVSSDRVLRGWTLELFLAALLIPPAFALIDAAARARARGARPSATMRRVLWRAGGLALGVLAIRLQGATGILPDAHSPPFAGDGGGGVSLWQIAFPLALGGAFGALAARRVAADPDPAGAGRYIGAHATLFAGAALAFAGNAYLLVFVIPALHLWLLLPATSRLGAVARTLVVLSGWLGPAAVIALLAGAGGFGVNAPAWFVRLVGDGGIPLASSLALAVLASATIELLWLAVAAGGGTRTGDGASPQRG
jgi:Peptidase family M28